MVSHLKNLVNPKHGVQAHTLIPHRLPYTCYIPYNALLVTHDTSHDRHSLVSIPFFTILYLEEFLQSLDEEHEWEDINMD